MTTKNQNRNIIGIWPMSKTSVSGFEVDLSEQLDTIMNVLRQKDDPMSVLQRYIEQSNKDRLEKEQAKQEVSASGDVSIEADKVSVDSGDAYCSGVVGSYNVEERKQEERRELFTRVYHRTHSNFGTGNGRNKFAEADAREAVEAFDRMFG